MHTTRKHADRLATVPHFREAIAVRPARLTERLAEAGRRDAFLALFANAPRKPDAIYELSRAEPRALLPDERQRRMIHEGIRDGYISRDQIVAYRAMQLLDDLAQFAGSQSAADALYVAFMKEAAEAVEAQTMAHGVPTPENKATAARETDDLVAVASMRVAMLRGL